MSARVLRLCVIGLAAVFTLGILGIAIWFAQQPERRTAATPKDPSVASADEPRDELDAAARAQRRIAAAKQIQPVSARAKSAIAPAGGSATLVVRVWDPPPRSEWNVSVDLQGVAPGTQVRRTLPSKGEDVVRFEKVPIGPVVEVLALEAHGRHMPRRLRIDPPLCDGEEREVRLIQPAEPAVVFRVLDPTGTPCKEAWIGARIAHGLSSRTPDDMRSLRTDADGRARLVLAAPEGAANGRWLCVHSAHASAQGTEGGEEHLASQIPVLCELPRRDTDVGDVRLEPEPIVASGIVVVPEGTEIPFGVMVTAALMAGTVEASVVLETSVGANGSFEVRSAVRGGMIALRAGIDGVWKSVNLLSGPLVTVPVGARDVRLHLVRGGAIRGSIVGAESKPPTILVTCLGGADAGGAMWVGPGPFAFERLPPGRYRIDVRPSGETQVPLLTIDGVMVTAGDDARDPRLQSIDVTALVRRVRVDLVDQDGRAVLEGGFRVSRGGTLVHRGEYSLGRIDVAVRMEPIDLAVDAPGFEIARASDVKDGQKVVLQRGRLLRLKLASRDLLESLQTVCVFVRLVPEGGKPGRTELRGFIDQGGESNFTNVVPGRWRVELELDVDSDAPGPHVAVRRAHPQVVSVTSEPSITAELEVTEDEIALARASLPD